MDDRQRLEAIVSVINKYLPPDGIPINDAMSEIISLVDPLPAPQPAQEPHEYDWSMLEAAKESLREHMARIKELEAALAQPAQEPDALTIAYQSGYYDGKKAALAQPAQKPYAFDWLPEGATHLGRLTVNEQYGGVLEMRTHAFKYEGGVLMVYRTDNDNEYPEWIDATKVFVHTNFQVFPIAPPQPAQEPRNVRERWNVELDGNDLLVCFNDHEKGDKCQYERYSPQRTWVGLTDEDIHNTAGYSETREMYKFALALIAKLKEKNNGT